MKYRPSNGTEGDCFRNSFCDRCIHDQEFQQTGKNGCVILANTLAFDVSDPNYPAEWQYQADGRPTCTAFVSVDNADQYEREQLEKMGQQRMFA